MKSIPSCFHVQSLKKQSIQPFFTAEAFTGTPGRFIPLEDTIEGFEGICEGKYDNIPEQAFYMVGNIQEALEKAKRL